MPKNKGKGGKKFKKGKHENLSKREMVFKDDGQAYAVVTKMLGNGRVNLCYFTQDKNNDFKQNEALGIIRGSMRKKVWISTNDIVLVSIRDYEQSKVDILHKYDNDEANSLFKSNEIPVINTNIENDNPEDLLSSFELGSENGDVILLNNITENIDEYDEYAENSDIDENNSSGNSSRISSGRNSRNGKDGSGSGSGSGSGYMDNIIDI